jgi:hypothetical protein
MENEQQTIGQKKCDCGSCWKCRGFFGSKLNTVLLLVLIILMVIALRFMLKNKEVYIPILSQQQTQQINQQQNNNISNTLPKYIGTMNTGAGWPPVVVFSLDKYSCTPNISEVSTTIEKIINGKKYCVTSSVDAAMSHRGGEYSYTTASGSGVKTANFSLYWPVCSVYGESDSGEYNECQTNQNVFFSNLDVLIDSAM